MEKMIAFLNSLHPLSAALEKDLVRTAHFLKKKKNEWLLHEGEVCRHAWYLQKGLVRCYYNRGEREINTWFLKEDNVVVLFQSLFAQKKSKYCLQALEDSTLYSIRIEDIQHLLRTYPEVRYIHTLLSDRFSNLKDLKIRATAMLTARERYRYFEKHFPQLLSRLKLEHIASYLDLSKRSIARARSS